MAGFGWKTRLPAKRRPPESHFLLIINRNIENGEHVHLPFLLLDLFASEIFFIDLFFIFHFQVLTEKIRGGFYVMGDGKGP